MNTPSLLLSTCFFICGLTPASVYSQAFSLTNVAGGSQGSANGADGNAQFNYPTGVAVDGSGNLYAADQRNNLIRKITPLGTDWIVTTVAGGGSGNLDGTNSGAQFFGPTGMAVDATGNLYVADQYNSVIRRISMSGTNAIVTTISGTAGVLGHQNGTNGAASFTNPAGIAVDGNGNLIVADEVDNAIRKITPVGTNWIATTLAGGSGGSADGVNGSAQFSGPVGVAVDAGGRVFVADQFNNTVRVLTPLGTNWVVTTIVGNTIAGRADGLGTNALLDGPLGVAVDGNENVYVTDGVNNAVRKLTPLGTNWAAGTNWMVSTIAGGSAGTNNGTGTNASFNVPFGVATDAFGDIFVADSQNNSIRVGAAAGSPSPTGAVQVPITPAGAVSAGAGWRLDGGSLQTSGATLSTLVLGNHTITFTTATGYTTPAAEAVVVTARQTAVATGNYPTAVPNAGSLEVIITPADAASAGALWQADNHPQQTNGGIVAGLTVGTHTLSFSAIPGWTTAASRAITITNGQTTLAYGNYILQVGSLQVTILPAAVVTSGAKWRVDGGSFQAGGATMPGLTPGSHTISFNTVLGWSTPTSQTVSITNLLASGVTVSYVQLVSQPPTLAGPTAGAGALHFTLNGTVGSNYVIQASTNLTVWTSIATNIMPATGLAPFTDSNLASFGGRFYRAVRQ
jgi:hypothetical protein